MRELNRICGDSSIRFAHYTKADTAEMIMKGQKVWLRNARLMNDYSEIEHGHECIKLCLEDATVRRRFDEVLSKLDLGFAERILNEFSSSETSRHEETYMVSLCEHKTSDRHGRLSMWRAYGGDTSVALVLNKKALFSNNIAVPVIVSPVLYAESELFKERFIEVIRGMEENLPFLKSLELDIVTGILTLALDYASLCTKHPGFGEETEWRGINSNRFRSLFQGIQPLVEKRLEINNVMQNIKVLPLKHDPLNGIIGLSVPDFVEEIIVGPMEFPNDIRDQMISALSSMGDKKASDKVRVSNIPLRRGQ